MKFLRHYMGICLFRRKNMDLSKYELKNIGFKANIDFHVGKNDWRKASITKYYLYNDKIYGLIILSSGQKMGAVDLETWINNRRIRVNNCSGVLPQYIKELHKKNIKPVYKAVEPQMCKKNFNIDSVFDDIEEITNYLDSRNVTSFLHFSPVCNLDSILKNGICSRNYCNFHNIRFQPTDEKRLDNLKDLISLSISFPNYQMRYKKEQEMKQHFIIIEIDPSIIKKFGVAERRFCNMNASSAKINKVIGPNLNHLKSMFAVEGVRKSIELPSQYTTDPQAEVLVKGPIPIEYIKKIYFNNSKDFSYYFEKYQSPLFSRKETFFMYRKDYAYHQTHAKIMKEDNTIWPEDLPF